MSNLASRIYNIWIIKALLNYLAIGAAVVPALIFAFYMTACPLPPVIPAAAIDCISADRNQIESLIGEFLPVVAGGKADWSVIETRAISAGETIGGCFLAEMIQNFMGGTKAVPTSDGIAAKNTFKDFRMNHAHGASFKTKYGSL